MKKLLVMVMALVLMASFCFTSCSNTNNEAEAYTKLNMAAQNVKKIASAIEGGWSFSINNTNYSSTSLRNFYVRDFANAIGFSEEAVRTAYIELRPDNWYEFKYYADAKKGDWKYDDYGDALREFKSYIQSYDKLFALISQVLKNEGILDLAENNVESAYELVKEVSEKSIHYDDLSTYYAEISTCYKNCKSLQGSYLDFSNMLKEYNDNISKLEAKLSVAYKK